MVTVSPTFVEKCEMENGHALIVILEWFESVLEGLSNGQIVYHKISLVANFYTISLEELPMWLINS